MPDIYDGTFLRKYIKTRSFHCFHKNNSIIYVWEDSNYASLAVSFSCIVNKVTWRNMFLEIYVLKNFESFTGKHLRKHPQTCKFIKKRLQHKCFPVKLLRTPFSTEQRRWLLFKINNRNKSVKRCFSDIPYPQPISSNLQPSQWQTNLKIHSLNKHFFR